MLGKHSARPEQVAEPTAQNAEQAVGQGAGGKDVTHLIVGQTQVLATGPLACAMQTRST